MLNAYNLSKNYKTSDYSDSFKALNNVNIHIEEGAFIGIMGPSGSGKTTLLNAISGLDKDIEGTIEINSQDLSKLTKDELAIFRRQKIGFVFQDFNLLEGLTFLENIALPVALDGQSASIISKKAHNVLDVLMIKDLKDKYPSDASRGQQQRAAIARAIVNEPKIIFADEPTGNLDSKSSKIIMDYLLKINQEKAVTIIMVTHDNFAASYCNQVLLLNDGMIKDTIHSTGDQKSFLKQLLLSL